MCKLSVVLNLIDNFSARGSCLWQSTFPSTIMQYKLILSLGLGPQWLTLLGISFLRLRCEEVGKQRRNDKSVNGNCDSSIFSQTE